MCRSFLALAALLLALVPADLVGQDPHAAIRQQAVAFIRHVAAERYDSAAARVAPAVKEQLSAEALGTLWPQVAAQVGALEGLEPGEVVEQEGLRVVQLRGTFTNGVFPVQVVFDAEGMVVGFFVRPNRSSGGAGGSPEAASR